MDNLLEIKHSSPKKGKGIFAKKNINLTRIESIPNLQGSFAFFLDFVGSKDDTAVTAALEEVEKITSNFRLMGCYNEIESD